MAYDIVGMQIYRHSRKKNKGTDYKLRGCEPRHRITVVRREVKKPFTLYESVQNIEDNTHKHDRYRHTALSFHKKRENE